MGMQYYAPFLVICLMRKAVVITLMGAVCGLMASCHVETQPHGDLYGFWHLEAVDTVGGASCDMGERRIFWSFENKLVECADRDGGSLPVVMRFEREGDSLFFDKPFFSDRPNGDPPVEDATSMQYYGLQSLRPRLCVEHLSSDRMTLSQQRIRLSFRKL